MKKTVLYLLLVVSMLLAGCSDSTTATTPAEANTPKPPISVPATVASGTTMDCTVISQEPTPGPTAESLFPPVTENDWVRGPDTASVTILEYSDFQ